MEKGSTSFATYLAKQLIAKKGYQPGTVAEAKELADAGDIVLTRTAGAGLEIVCIIDGQANPTKRFELTAERLAQIGKDCLKHSGTVNGVKMPVVIQLMEVRTPITEADRRRLASVKRWGGFKKVALSAWVFDPMKRELWTNSHFNGALTGRRFYERLLREPRENDEKLFQPAAAIPTNPGPPFVTYALLAILIAVFAAEILLAVGPITGFFNPGVRTLFALGGLNRELVLQSGEWYRLFTAPLLHGDAFHLLMNGIALFFAGRLLEGLVGRAWFAALFVVGGLGGSLLSIAINPPNIVSVGASGAIMALAAAAMVISYRLGPSVARTQIQHGLLQILVPSLIPLATHFGGKVDYGAHLGGAITGVIAGLGVMQTWSRTSALPSRRTFAFACSIAALAVVAYAVIPLMQQYKSYQLAALMMPRDKVPATNEDGKKRSVALLADYPRDPRSHVYRALALADANDLAGAEGELRLALSDKEIMDTMFKPEFEGSVRNILVAVLVQRDDMQGAKSAARPVCAGGLGEVPEWFKKIEVCERK